MRTETYKIVEHDGGWAYRVDGVFSETFPSHDAARAAAERAAAEQRAAAKRPRSPMRTPPADGTRNRPPPRPPTKPKSKIDSAQSRRAPRPAQGICDSACRGPSGRIIAAGLAQTSAFPPARASATR